MKVIGFRCSPKEITFSILMGDKGKPKVHSVNTIKLPKGLKRIQEIKWIYLEIEDLIKNENPTLIGIKDTEIPARKGNSYSKRLENETVIIVASAMNGVKNSFKKIKSTIAKDLGLKGKARYLETKLDTTIIDGYENYKDIEKESILIAWSILR